MKSIVVYFSHRGQNYNVGYLTEGNAEHIAKVIQKYTDSEIFELIPEVPYPEDYNKCTEVALDELHKEARPKYKGDISNLSDYDVIYLCYPNWWGTYPRIISTFIESHEIKGKKIKPMCTHEGSGMGRSVEELKRSLKDSHIARGLAIQGIKAKKSDREISNWIEEN